MEVLGERKMSNGLNVYIIPCSESEYDFLVISVFSLRLGVEEIGVSICFRWLMLFIVSFSFVVELTMFLSQLFLVVVAVFEFVALFNKDKIIIAGRWMLYFSECIMVTITDLRLSNSYTRHCKFK